MMNSLQDALKRLRAPPPLRPPLRPPDVTHVMNRTRPSAFFAALPHPCIIVNGNRRTDKNGVGLGTRLTTCSQGWPGRPQVQWQSHGPAILIGVDEKNTSSTLSLSLRPPEIKQKMAGHETNVVLGLVMHRYGLSPIF